MDPKKLFSMLLPDKITVNGKTIKIPEVANEALKKFGFLDIEKLLKNKKLKIKEKILQHFRKNGTT